MGQPVGVGEKEIGVRRMKRKRMIKLLMSVGCDRNDAVKAANLCDGSTSHAEIYHELCVAFAKVWGILHDDLTGEIAGMIGSVYG